MYLLHLTQEIATSGYRPPRNDMRFKKPVLKSNFQVGVGVQDVVLEDVAGLDGLHQAQVVGVNDSGGQTLHHAHCDQSGVHNGGCGRRYF